MKTLLALLATLCVTTLHAQIPIVDILYAGGTNNIAAATTVTNSATYNVRDYRQLGLYSTWTLPAGTNGFLTLNVHRSFDNGTTYETNAWFSLSATNMSVATNVDLGAATNFKIRTLQNGNTNAITNLYVAVSLKK